MQVVCAGCSLEFNRKPSWVAKHALQFCSRGCVASYTRTPTDVGIIEKGRLATLACNQCGSIFTRSTDRIKPVNYCSHACVWIARIGIKRGHNPKTQIGQIRQHGGYLEVFLGVDTVGGNGYYSHHRYVVEQSIGRKLKSGEHVHHKNRNREDNRIENLEVLSSSEHMSRHGKESIDRFPLCICGRRSWPGSSQCKVCRRLDKLDAKYRDQVEALSMAKAGDRITIPKGTTYFRGNARGNPVICRAGFHVTIEAIVLNGVMTGTLERMKSMPTELTNMPNAIIWAGGGNTCSWVLV